MDNLDNTPALQPAPSDAGAIQERLDSLQQLLISALILMIIVSGTVAVYMRRQAKITRVELDSIRPQTEAINAQYQRLTGPSMDDFAKKLAEYGAKHPDFAPILSKYGVMRAGPTGAIPPTAKAPLTSAPAPAKK